MEIPLDHGWLMQRSSKVAAGGDQITSPGFDVTEWIEAEVPGTVLGNLVRIGKKPFEDPYYGLNNETIPEISDPSVTPAFYTYWFYLAFDTPKLKPGQRVWLRFRGINYKAQLYLNGAPVGAQSMEGMFLRHAFDVTDVLTGSQNRMAVLIQPPDPPGTPGGNGGQQGAPNIGENVTMRYTVGWDWVQPVRDRNTGIWDRVDLLVTGPVRVVDPYVVTTVLDPEGKLQDHATLSVSAEVQNPTSVTQTVTLKYTLRDTQQTASLQVSVPHGQTVYASFPDFVVDQPRLWWPNGVDGPGPRELYDLEVTAEIGGTVSDSTDVRFGIRQVTSPKPAVDPTTNGRLIRVNGQEIFIRGGNWIGTDAMLRRQFMSAKRYDDEVHLLADMNLNMLRVWGGGIAERPEFYAACDTHGILVMQDFWISGEFRGPFPPGYADLFLENARDTIKLLRNHPSLCFWCGGNEWPPPNEVGDCLRCYIEGRQSDGTPCDFPSCGAERVLDGARSYVACSTSGPDGLGPGDGPYGIVNPDDFFQQKWCGFNPEVGSVGTPVADSIRAMMPAQAANDLPTGTSWNATWKYHTYIPYENMQQGQVVPCSGTYPSPTPDQIDLYGTPTDLDAFGLRAQIVNHVQYKSFFEGFNARMWERYTGVLAWKAQNPWTGLRGSFYDWTLDQNGGAFGVRSACEPVHLQFDLDDQTVLAVNNTFRDLSDLEGQLTVMDLSGHVLHTEPLELPAAPFSISKRQNTSIPDQKGVYLVMLTGSSGGSSVPRNLYWLASDNDFSALQSLPALTPSVKGTLSVEGDDYVLDASVSNGSAALAFFLRLRFQKAGAPSGQDARVLPTFYSDNDLTLLPGESHDVTIRCAQADAGGRPPELWMEGWNVPRSRAWTGDVSHGT